MSRILDHAHVRAQAITTSAIIAGAQRLCMRICASECLYVYYKQARARAKDIGLGAGAYQLALRGHAFSPRRRGPAVLPNSAQATPIKINGCGLSLFVIAWRLDSLLCDEDFTTASAQFFGACALIVISQQKY